jgi:dihydroneopterin aldolase
MRDRILIEQLELSAHVGVPDEEREAPQRLTVTLTLEPDRGFADLGDDLAQTIDYFHVSKAVQALARRHPRKLIETLADEIAATLLADYPLAAVEVELRKYILPDTAFVAIQLRRERSWEAQTT